VPVVPLFAALLQTLSAQGDEIIQQTRADSL
jgi:hypothetical protein